MTEKQLRDFLQALDEVERMTETPEKARKFLQDTGLLDSNGDLALPYR
jgi:hypothetical protein